MDPNRLPAELRAQAVRIRRAGLRRRILLGRLWDAEEEIGHLVPRPVFVLCSVRSGSTLLRSILDTHTHICAPHELHLATMRVTSEREYAVQAWAAVGMTTGDLENLLWDRALHRMLVRSGKRIVVDKTPQNVTVWRRIHEFWPQARYVHLRRHPVAVYESLRAAQPDRSAGYHMGLVADYARQLNEARAALPGPTVRYEELTTDPRTTIGTVCDYLGVRFQPRMLHYRTSANRAGLGDWSARIRSRQIQAHAPLPSPDEVPAQLAEVTRAWGY